MFDAGQGDAFPAAEGRGVWRDPHRQSRIDAAWMPKGWLRSVEHAVCEKIEHVEVSRAGEDTLTLALGTRGVVLHTTPGFALLAPSFAAGGTIASRPESRVQHLDPISYALSDGTVLVVADAIIAHLRPA